MTPVEPQEELRSWLDAVGEVAGGVLAASKPAPVPSPEELRRQRVVDAMRRAEAKLRAKKPRVRR